MTVCPPDPDLSDKLTNPRSEPQSQLSQKTVLSVIAGLALWLPFQQAASDWTILKAVLQLKKEH